MSTAKNETECEVAKYGYTSDRTQTRSRTTRRVHKTMTDENRVENAPDATPASSQQSAASTATASGKRQRSILDMFASKDSEPPAVKKTRLDNGTPKITAGPVVPLNSIPFSLSEYMASIPTENRKFLELEGECMGKSWYVYCTRISHC